MISSELVHKLHEQKVIDKRFPFWWQLGFEGRKILTDNEFSEGLREVSYWAIDQSQKDSEEFKVNMKIWVHDNVPIVLRNARVKSQDLPCFITACPMSHERGWKNLQFAISSNLPPYHIELIYHQPHIRGLAIDSNKDFLFWYPFLLGRPARHYSNNAIYYPKTDTWLMLDPVHPHNFYNNLLSRGFLTGRKAHQKPEPLNLKIRNLEQVPYFEFNPSLPHITTYPLPIFEDSLLTHPHVKAFSHANPRFTPEQLKQIVTEYPYLFHLDRKKMHETRLELPVVIRSSESGKAEILGAGYVSGNFAYYHRLNPKQLSIAKQAMKQRLGLDSIV